ncbi:hypothetical protein OHR68_07085 [Spirillospora sp. NBC_00431]
MDEGTEHLLAGSYRRETVVSSIEYYHVDVIIDVLPAFAIQHDIGKANAEFTEMLGRLKRAYRAVEQGAEVQWADSETGHTIIVQAKCSSDKRTTTPQAAVPSCHDWSHSFIPGTSTEDLRAQIGVLGDEGRDGGENAELSPSMGSGKYDHFVDLLLQAAGRCNRHRSRIDPAEGLELLRRLMRAVRKAKRVVARLLSQLSFPPFLTKVIAVRRLDMHRGEDDPDSLLYLRRHHWTVGRRAI